MLKRIDQYGRRCGRKVKSALVVGAGLTLLAGCEVKSFFDPSVTGRWKNTPVVLPILDQLDVIDEPPQRTVGLSEVTAEDLVPDLSEYVVGPGDTLTVNVFELIAPGVESIQTRKIDELGMIRLPVINDLKAAGFTPSQIEKKIAQILEQRGQLKNATVSVIVLEGRQRTYTVIGEPTVAGTGIGQYTLPKSDFRIMDAMALARGVPGRIKKLYVIRPVQPEGAATPTPDVTGGAGPKTRPTVGGAADVVDDLTKGLEGSAAPKAPAATPATPVAPPPGMQAGLDENKQRQTWVNVEGKWIRVAEANPGVVYKPGSAPGNYQTRASGIVTARAIPGISSATQAALPLVAQRIIEVPYNKLLDGDLNFNVVIRPGDIIHVPSPAIGNVYIGGAISRPGTYLLPGERELNLKQLVTSAGNLSPLAIPERVDLIRRIGDNQEATVRLNLKAIFDGEQPDLFLKPNDMVNVGTNWIATPLAVFRNGFRMSYGFGFILDRNFGGDVFGAEPVSR
ncbi:MAG: polysaccharide biosynthesis/export family protein [Planctomycetota bacterium]|nr:polysaccharide biosynthesis/export family protein [Planctomycetota bacterium]